MKYKYPNYYKKFSCTANECEATCCAGWEIVIDDESIDKYLNIRTEFGNRLCNSIDFAEGVFHQDKNKRCAFLNEKNLCDIYTEIGEEYLCYTCTQYPRHIEEFEDGNEISLSISCPEVAKMILNHEEKVTFYEEEKEEETEPYEEFDVLFYEMLYEAREVLFSILQDRALSVDARIKLTSLMTYEIQEKIDEYEIFEIDAVIQKYERYDELIKEMEESEQRFKQGEHEIDHSRQCYQMIQKYVDNQFSLEALQDEWPSILKKYQELLYEERSYEEYINQREVFCNQYHDIMERMKEQLMVYFIYSYYCGAVYDGMVLAKYQLGLVTTLLIEELWFAKYLENGNQITNEEMCRVVYRYAREIEHSDQNLDLLEEIYIQ